MWSRVRHTMHPNKQKKKYAEIAEFSAFNFFIICVYISCVCRHGIYFSFFHFDLAVVVVQSMEDPCIRMLTRFWQNVYMQKFLDRHAIAAVDAICTTSVFFRCLCAIFLIWLAIYFYFIIILSSTDRRSVVVVVFFVLRAGSKRFSKMGPDT